MIIGDELAATASQHASDGGGSDCRSIVVIAAQQAAQLEVEDVPGVGERDVVGEGAGQT